MRAFLAVLTGGLAALLPAAAFAGYLSALNPVGSVGPTDSFYDCQLNSCSLGTIGTRASALQIDQYILSTLSATSPLSYNPSTGVFSLPSGSPNLFLATPNGTSGALSERAIVGADLPLATNSTIGGMRGDGTTINCTAGVCSSSGGGSVTSIGLLMPGVFNIGGTNPITSAGVFNVTATGTSGGVYYFNGTDMASSIAGAANSPMLWGGAGSGPTSGTKTGNTNQFATGNGAPYVNGHIVSIDASGNLIDSGVVCCGTPGGGTVTSVQATTPSSWLTVTGGPITTAGTLAFAGATGASSHQFVGTGSGTSVGLTALGASDLPTLATLAPGLATNNASYNTGTQTLSAAQTLSFQFINEAHSTSYSVLSTDSGKRLISTGASLTFTVPNPGATGSGGFQFGSDGTHPFTLTTVGGTALIYGCPAAGAGATSVTFGAGLAADILTDGTNYNCVEYGGGGGGGGVTSVAMTGDGTVFNSAVTGSPITTSGTLAPSLHTQSANTVLAGPTSGGAVAPTFRAIVTGDLPTTGVGSGSCNNCNLTYNAQGNITVAANGSGSGVSVTASTPNVVINPSPGTGTFTVGTTAAGDQVSTQTYTIGNNGGTSCTADNGHTKVFTFASGAISITLPNTSTTGCGGGFSFGVCMDTTQSGTITPNSPSTIAGGSSLAVPANTCVQVANVIGTTNFQAVYQSGGIASGMTTGQVAIASGANSIGSSRAIGTSGAVIPLLNGNNTFSGTSTYTGTVIASNIVTVLATGNLDASTVCGGTVHYQSSSPGTITLLANGVAPGCNFPVDAVSTGLATIATAAGGTQVSACTTPRTRQAHSVLWVHVESNAGTAPVINVSGDCG